MKTLKKIFAMAIFPSIVFTSIVPFYSCSEDEGKKCLDCAELVKEKVGFDTICIRKFKIDPLTKDFRYYYDGSYYFTNIIKEDTFHYFINNPNMIRVYKEDSAYAFTVNIYNSTNILLQKNYNGHQFYYEVEILEEGLQNSIIEGWKYNPVSNEVGPISGHQGEKPKPQDDNNQGDNNNKINKEEGESNPAKGEVFNHGGSGGSPFIK